MFEIIGVLFIAFILVVQLANKRRVKRQKGEIVIYDGRTIKGRLLNVLARISNKWIALSIPIVVLGVLLLRFTESSELLDCEKDFIEGIDFDVSSYNRIQDGNRLLSNFELKSIAMASEGDFDKNYSSLVQRREFYEECLKANRSMNKLERQYLRDTLTRLYFVYENDKTHANCAALELELTSFLPQKHIPQFDELKAWYSAFKSHGYSDSFSEFHSLIIENPEALDYLNKILRYTKVYNDDGELMAENLLPRKNLETRVRNCRQQLKRVNSRFVENIELLNRKFRRDELSEVLMDLGMQELMISLGYSD